MRGQFYYDMDMITRNLDKTTKEIQSDNRPQGWCSKQWTNATGLVSGWFSRKFKTTE